MPKAFANSSPGLAQPWVCAARVHWTLKALANRAWSSQPLSAFAIMQRDLVVGRQVRA